MSGRAVSHVQGEMAGDKIVWATWMEWNEVTFSYDRMVAQFDCTMEEVRRGMHAPPLRILISVREV
jgi:hypothetical protein